MNKIDWTVVNADTGETISKTPTERKLKEINNRLSSLLVELNKLEKSIASQSDKVKSILSRLEL